MIQLTLPEDVPTLVHPSHAGIHRQRAVPGLEISQREPTPEELAALWDRNVWRNTRSETGFSYRMDVREKLDESLGFDVLDRSVLECYRDGNPIWSVEFPDLYVEDGVHTSAGTAVWGHNDTWSSEQPELPSRSSFTSRAVSPSSLCPSCIR